MCILTAVMGNARTDTGFSLAPMRQSSVKTPSRREKWWFYRCLRPIGIKRTGYSAGGTATGQ
jgi:hypothetical protein